MESKDALNTFNIAKVYLLITHERTGGPFSMHQLGAYLEKCGYNVIVCYCKKEKFINVQKPLFENISLSISNYIMDDFSSVIIIPETLTSWRLNFRRAKVIIWWLSLDYYRLNNIWWAALWGTKIHMLPIILYPVFFMRYLYKRHILKTHNKNSLLSKAEFRSYIHLYNTEHTRMYLREHFCSESNMHYLCGPIDEVFVANFETALLDRKKNIVAYNPAKVDKHYVNRIIKQIKKIDNTIEIIKIKDMSKAEVYNVLENAKVYFELGYFPGPERLPREAVCMYCNIITSKSGSAGSNDKDVPIPELYKHDIYTESPSVISKQIVELVSDYKSHVLEYDEYRKYVINQISRFESDIKDIVEKYL